MTDQRSKNDEFVVPDWLVRMKIRTSGEFVLEEVHPNATVVPPQQNLTDQEYEELKCLCNGRVNILGYYDPKQDWRVYYCVTLYLEHFGHLPEYNEQRCLGLASQWASQYCQDLLKKNDYNYTETELWEQVYNPEFSWDKVELGTLYIFDKDYVYDSRLADLTFRKHDEDYVDDRQYAKVVKSNPYVQLNNYDGIYFKGDVQIYYCNGKEQKSGTWYSFNGYHEWRSRWGGIVQKLKDGKHENYNLLVPVYNENGDLFTKEIFGGYNAQEANDKMKEVRKHSLLVNDAELQQGVQCDLYRHPLWRPAFQLKCVDTPHIGYARYPSERLVPKKRVTGAAFFNGMRKKMKKMPQSTSSS